jgi:hypothetical protein
MFKVFMRSKLLLFTALFFLLGFVAVAASRQGEIKKVSENVSVANTAEAKFEEVRSRLKGPLPFQPGERLTYELRLSRFPFYGIIGELTFKVNDEPPAPEAEKTDTKKADAEKAEAEKTPTAQPPSEGEKPVLSPEDVRPGPLKIQAEAEAKGILTSIFRYKVSDLFVSYIDRADFGVIKTEKKIEEGKKKQESNALFDRQRRMVKWTNRDLNKPEHPVDIKEKETFGWVTDIVAGWYVLRAQPLKIGESITFPLSDNGETFEIEVKALEREDVEIELGKFSTMKLEMKLFNGKFIKRKGRLFLWVTDDERHVPIKAQIKFESGFGGTVNVTLIEMDKVKEGDKKA